MDTKLLSKVEEQYKKQVLPNIEAGDTIEVVTKIRDEEGKKLRSQKFKGIVLGTKGVGVRQTITVRKISYGVGVEKIFPIHSPNIENIEVIKKGSVRKSKIYYMRGRIGKSAMKINDSKKEVELVTYREEKAEEKKVDETEANENAEAKKEEEKGEETKDEKKDEAKDDQKEGKKEEKNEEKKNEEKESKGEK